MHSIALVFPGKPTCSCIVFHCRFTKIAFLGAGSSLGYTPFVARVSENHELRILNVCTGVHGRVTGITCSPDAQEGQARTGHCCLCCGAGAASESHASGILADADRRVAWD